MPEESGEVTAEQLLAAAEQYDAAVDAGETPVVEIQTAEPEVEEKPEEILEKIAEDSAGEVEAKTEPDSEKQDADNPVGSLTEGEAPEEGKPQSKWEKNEARKASAWVNINKRKEEQKLEGEKLAQEREELESIRRELSDARNSISSGEEYRDEKGLTARDYEESVEILRAGDEPEAVKEKLVEGALKRAAELRLEGKRVIESKLQREAEGQWEKVKGELEEEHSDLTDADKPLTRETNKVLADYPDLINVPNAQGLRYAVQIAQWKMGAESSESSQAQVKELTDKLTKLEKKMSIGGGFTGDRPDGERKFEDLSDDEQANHLLRAAMDFDEGR